MCADTYTLIANGQQICLQPPQVVPYTYLSHTFQGYLHHRSWLAYRYCTIVFQETIMTLQDHTPPNHPEFVITLH